MESIVGWFDASHRYGVVTSQAQKKNKFRMDGSMSSTRRSNSVALHFSGRRWSDPHALLCRMLC
jgi:hypothetical protein